MITTLDPVFAIVGDGAADDTTGLQKACDALPDGGWLYLHRTMRLTRTVRIRGRRGIGIIGAPGASLRRGWGASYAQRAVLYLEDCTDVLLTGFEIVGSTPLMPAGAPYAVWNDDGLHLIACRRATVDRLSIRDCGDSWLRCCGSFTEEVPANGKISAFDYRVLGCRLHNAYQSSTTPAGLSGYEFRGNTITGLRGSVKFSSRNPGAGGLVIAENSITGSVGADGKPDNRQGGIEIHGYDGCVIEDNVITGCNGDAGVTLRDSELGGTTVPWNNVRMRRNVITGCKQRTAAWTNAALPNRTFTDAE